MSTDFESFISHFKNRLHHLFNVEGNINELSIERGLPKTVWNEIMEPRPLSVAIPEKFDGRGVSVKECLQVLSAASYESLSLSLTFGINIALFLEPLAKYGQEKIQKTIFKKFLDEKAMGGLMITEPDYGSDALNMQTLYQEGADSYQIKGEKHWQGLTGMADFWIVAAREKNTNSDNLSRDISFFVTDNAEVLQKIQVQELYNNLGLYMIPYGLNTIDISVPKSHRLVQKSTGLKMMLDILHRSRMQFPGMGMGFIQRMLDEALHRCTTRVVAGKSLSELDSVRYQLSQIQAAYTLCSGMCTRSVEISGIENDLSGQGLEANSVKALVTDLMQESAQICTQLSGANGYKLDHIAGRGIVDSRPFQIFEGPNEMLYTQIAEMTLKAMKRKKESRLYAYLKQSDLCRLVADHFKENLQFEPGTGLAQRQLVSLGKLIAYLINLQYVHTMTERGFRQDLYENCVKHVQAKVRKLSGDVTRYNDAEPILDYKNQSDWTAFVG